MFVITDVETTGLNPEVDELLEIGILVVDNNFVPIGSFEKVKHYIVTNQVNSYVKNMHEKSGLWDACQDSKLTLAEIEEQALAFLDQFAPSSTIPLTGSTISFDRSFLARYTPSLMSWFHYRNIDTRSFYLLAEAYGKPTAPKGLELHRSLSDCIDSAQALAFYKKLFIGNTNEIPNPSPEDSNKI